MLAGIAKLDEVRRKVQKMMKYADGSEGARQAAKDGSCSELWDAILVLTERAKNLNELNGMQLNMHIDQNRRLMDFINKASGTPLYGRDGKSQRKSLGAISTKA
jgi:flagella synthesis protein FlgN